MPVISSRVIRTLGLRTDVAIEAERAIVEQHDGFIALRTPRNPSYYFGNVLIFDRAPQRGDDVQWPALFAGVFVRDTAVRHAAFAWSIDGDQGDIEPFLQRGYTFEDRAVLSAQTLREAAVPNGLDLRALDSDADWRAQLNLALATRDPVHEEQAYARFKVQQIAHQRRLARSMGVWLGAFEGDRLAGSCGIFVLDDGTARYQDVGVLPAYRNQGIARALIAAAARFAITTLRAQQLVIVAADDFPRTIYERMGFTLVQREGALWIAHR